MEHDAVIDQVRDFLSQYISNPDIDADENLFETGAVNSLFAMQLVLFVEKDFGIQVANEDLDFANFRSINAIVEFINSKTGTEG